jgi:hypothetical protein
MGRNAMMRHESAARVTHLPTGLSAMSRVYRRPSDCLAAATAMVRAMLARRGEEPSWSPLDGRGPVIRTYDLLPRRRPRMGPVVRDHASGVLLPLGRHVFDGGPGLERAMVARRRGMEGRS